MDEDTFSRELALLAGVYPAVRLGAPCRFLDTLDGMRRYREAVTDTAGPLQHDGIRRRHARSARSPRGTTWRAGSTRAGSRDFVAEHRLDLDEVVQVG